MDLKDQVCTLLQAKKLKELGMNQVAIFSWYYSTDRDDEPALNKLHCAGRLDLDTTGLLLVTDDGQWSHRITSPRHECAKTYRAWLADPVEPAVIEQFASGVQLRGERQLTRPAELELVTPTEALLTIHEGKYHQVKRMFAAVGNKVIRLHRERVGSLALGSDLAPGQYRALTPDEIAAF